MGGGDSKLVDKLLEMDFKNITVLDISEKALERAKERLGQKTNTVKWIECDSESLIQMTDMISGMIEYYYIF